MDWNPQGARKRIDQEQPGKEQENENCRKLETAGNRHKG
jgi:hypothetical protein